MNAAEVLSRVREGGLLAPGRPVLVMLSGGQDSVCLLDLAVRICGAEAVHALHMNYGLRGEASEQDAAYCAQLCSRLGVALTSRHPQKIVPAGRSSGNLQAWARDERYAAAHEVATARDDREIAAGHTASDQVETILYRLASSPSRRALLGMRPRQGRLVRPLLGVWRADTEAYCRSRGLAWRADATNADRLYARGRVRKEVVPALRAVHPAAEMNVLAVAEILRDETAVLDGLVDEVLGGEAWVDLAALRRLPTALGRLVVQRLADAAVGRPAAGVARRLSDLLALPDRGPTHPAHLDLPSGVRATVRCGRLSFAARRDAVSSTG